MYKAFMITCIASVCLLCGCSSVNTNNSSISQQTTKTITSSSSSTSVSSDDNSVKKQLNGIWIWDGEIGAASKDVKSWSLHYSTYNGEDTPYSFSVSGTFENGYVDESGIFSKDKGDSIFKWLENCKMQHYEPEHPNADGLLITEYKPYSVKMFYTLYDSDNNIIYNTNDPRYDKNETECYYTLSEDDYNTLKNMLEELRKAIDNSLVDQGKP